MGFTENKVISFFCFFNFSKVTIESLPPENGTKYLFFNFVIIKDLVFCSEQINFPNPTGFGTINFPNPTGFETIKQGF